MQEAQTCPQCGLKVANPKELQEHMNREHAGTSQELEGKLEGTWGGEGQETCPVCSARFPSAESMEEHRRTEHGGPASNV